MITGDLSAALATAAAAAVASGGLADDAGLAADPGLAAGTWRPVPPEAGGGPGRYATTLPFVLAHRGAADPALIADVLAAALRPGGTGSPSTGSPSTGGPSTGGPSTGGPSTGGPSTGGPSTGGPGPGGPGSPTAGGISISSVAVTGGGYLSITVTPDTLAWLAVRIAQAGPGCAASLALRGTRVTAPSDARLAGARDWADAWQRLTAEQAGRLAEAAGADVTWTAPAAGEPGPVAGAVAYAGEDAVRFSLSRLARRPRHRPPELPGPALDPGAMAAQHPGNPAYAVRYAHAHAASALRQAADLGLPGPDAERFQPYLLAHPSEQVLLDAMSWLPERVAGAARRRQPHVVAAYLENLAGRYFDWQEACPVMRPGTVAPRPPDLPPGGRPPPGAELIQARLQLASAARTALGTGLGLLGIAAPGRM